MAYRQTLNGFALKQLVKPCEIPDYHLMVGSAEDLTPKDVVLYKNYVNKDLVVKQAELTHLADDEIERAINDNLLEVNDFNLNLVTIDI